MAKLIKKSQILKRFYIIFSNSLRGKGQKISKFGKIDHLRYKLTKIINLSQSEFVLITRIKTYKI